MVQWLRLNAPNAGGPGSVPWSGKLEHSSSTEDLVQPKKTHILKINKKKRSPQNRGVQDLPKVSTVCAVATKGLLFFSAWSTVHALGTVFRPGRLEDGIGDFKIKKKFLLLSVSMCVVLTGIM